LCVADNKSVASPFCLQSSQITGHVLCCGLQAAFVLVNDASTLLPVRLTGQLMQEYEQRIATIIAQAALLAQHLAGPGNGAPLSPLHSPRSSR
jgi:hypothetical protein